MKTKVLTVIGLVGLLAFQCTKDKQKETLDNDVTTAVDNTMIDNAFDDVQNISDQAASGTVLYFPSFYENENGKYQVSNLKTSCASVTHDGVKKTIYINFGSTNCMCKDGKNRRGQINVSYTGKYRDSLSVHTISFTNYFVNDNQLLGTKTVTNNGRNTDGHLNFSIFVNGKMVKSTSLDTIEWVSDRKRIWIKGESTLLNWDDDVYTISGKSSGVNSAGVSYTAVITTPLRRALSCPYPYFDTGVIEITPSGKLKRVIDFGNGTCDASATVTIAGYSFPISL